MNDGISFKKFSFWKIDAGAYIDTSGKFVSVAIKELKESKIEPAYPYAVSSVEMNMFKSYWYEALEIALDRKIIKVTEAFDLILKVQKMLDKTEYTNWSGD